ncbi:MAG: tetratricopeptide repeat protein [Thermoplasmatota archaeon]
MGVSDSLMGTNTNCKFVNRWGEMDELKEHMKQVLNENGKFVILKGEAGIGKTRMAERFSQECIKNDFEFLWGRCLYHESTDPYIPFIEALDEYLEGESESSESNDSGYLGLGAKFTNQSSSPKSISLVGLGSSKPESIDISISDEREVMFTKILNLIKKLSKEHPLLLFLDDLQWIDESSSQLLHLLVRNLTDYRVFILGAYRPEELKTHGEKRPLEILLDRTKQEGIVDIIEVDRLGFQPVSEMVRNQLNSSGLPESFLLTIYKETEGNPYYVIEILNSMVDEGIINPYSYKWNPEEELTNITIPTSIKDITNRRIERLDDLEKKVLMYASVIGKEFNFEILEKAIDLDVLKLLDVCDELEDHGIISEKQNTDEEVYRFNHLQLRLTMYDNMGKTRKRILNKKIGEAIEEFYDDMEGHYSSLSRHFFEGKVYDKAYEYSLKSAEKAVNTFAIETAIKRYKNALQSLRKSKDLENKEKKEISILKHIGNLSYEISELDGAEKSFRSLLNLAEKLGDKKTTAYAMRWLGHTYRELQDFQESYDCYEKALELYTELNDNEGCADCKRGIGYLMWREGKFEQSIKLYNEVIEEAQDLDDENILSQTYIEMGNTYAQKGENEKAIEYYKKSVSYFEKQNAYKNLARAFNNMGDQFMKMGEWDKAIGHFKKTVEISKKLGDNRVVGWGYFNMAEALARKGDLEKANNYTSISEKIMRSLDDKVGLSSVYRVNAIIKRMKNDWNGALDSLEKSWEFLGNMDIPFARAENKYELGRLYMDKNEPEKSINQFGEARKIFEDLGATQYLEKIKKHIESLED